MSLIPRYIKMERATGVNIHTRSSLHRRHLTRSTTSYGTTLTAAWRMLQKSHPA